MINDPKLSSRATALRRRTLLLEAGTSDLQSCGTELYCNGQIVRGPAGFRRIPRRYSICGFTLIEMMVAISVLLILLAIAIPRYSASIQAAREENLRKNLETLNEVIYEYTIDKQKAPKSLEDLKSAGYIDEIPNDITGQTDWVPIEEEDTILTLGEKETGIIGVHSGSNAIGSDGRAYSEW